MRYACFTSEQQKQFDSLSEKQRKYIVYRSKGVSRREAYLNSGYSATPKNAGTDPYKMERANPIIGELISCMSANGVRVKISETVESTMDKIERAVGEDNVRVIEKLAKEPNPERIPVLGGDAVSDLRLKKFENMSSEDAKRITFYRDIADGKTKNVKITKSFDKDGNLTGKKVEESIDIESRIKARKEIDRILGLQSVIDLGQLSAGNINITIVDASKKNEIDDQRKEEIVGTTEETEVEDGKQ